MAGTAPTDFQFTRTLDAGPVHCSVWLACWRCGLHSAHHSARTAGNFPVHVSSGGWMNLPASDV